MGRATTIEPSFQRRSNAETTRRSSNIDPRAGMGMPDRRDALHLHPERPTKPHFAATRCHSSFLDFLKVGMPSAVLGATFGALWLGS